MLKVFSYLSKQKKIVFWVVLVFVLAGVVLPQATLAGQNNPFATSVPTNPCSNFDIKCNVVWVITALISYGFKFALAPTIILPLLILDLLTTIMAFLATTIFKWILALSIAGVAYTSLNPAVSPAVAIGWPIARNFANMIVVLGFIVIAVATILRIKEYEAKALLAKLVIAALLVNFSLVICGIVIDVSNITMNFFINGTNTTLWNNFLDLNTLRAMIERFVSVFIPNTNIFDIMARYAGGIFYNIMNIVVMLLYIFLFLFRIIVLWILVIVSPLAFVCYVFPITKGMVFDKWWNNFFQWCFVGVFGAFFLFIGTELNYYMASNRQLLRIENLVTGAAEWGQVALMMLRYLTNLFQFIVPGMFLVIGFIFSLQMSAMGGSAAIGAFKGAAKLAKVGGKWGADKTGLTKNAQKIGDRMTQAFEGSLLPRGYTEASKRRRQQPSRDAEDAAAANTAQQRMDVVNAGPGRGTKSTEEWMANFERMEQNGELANMNSADLRRAQDTRVQETGRTGAYSLTPETAILDTDRAAELRAEYKQDGTESNVDYMFRINDMLTKEANDNMNTKKIDKMTDTELSRLSNERNSKGSKATEKLIKDGKKHLVRGGTATDVEAAIDDAQLHGASTSLYSKASPDLATKDEDKIKELLAKKGKTRATANPTEIADAEKVATREAYDRMDTKDIKAMNDTDLVKLAEEKTAEGAKALEIAIERGIVDRVKGGNIDQQLELLGRAKTNYGSGAKKSAAKVDPRLAGFSMDEMADRMDELENDPYGPGTSLDPATSTDQAKRESVQKVSEAYEKLSPDEMSKLSKDAINMDLVENTTAKKIREAGKKLKKEQIKNLKDLLNDIENEINTTTDPERKADLEEKFEEILFLK